MPPRSRSWHQHTPAHYDKAQFKQAVVSSEGAPRLSRQLKPLAGLDATHVWDIVEDQDGNLFVATGDEGKIYKVTPDGKASVALHQRRSQVLCLAPAADGVRLRRHRAERPRSCASTPTGKAKVFCETGESYVWSLAVDAKTATLYAGTGPKGRIYRINPEGKATVFYTTKQDHVLCLAAGADGTLYAGTDKGGLVYRIDAKGKGFVLYQAPQAEVRSLKVTPRRRLRRHQRPDEAASAAAPPRPRQRPVVVRRRGRDAEADVGQQEAEGRQDRDRAGRDGGREVLVRYQGVEQGQSRPRRRRRRRPARTPSTASPSTAACARCSARRR